VLSVLRKQSGISRRRQRRLFDLSFGKTWGKASVGRLKEEVRRADDMGMRPNAFAKAGDSNLGAYNSLYGLGCREPLWGDHAGLEPVMRRYREVVLPPGEGPPPHVHPPADRQPWNSFSRSSAATHSGCLAAHVLAPASEFQGLPGWVADPDCPPEDSMLEFEIRTLKPRYVFVMFGTNGSSFGFTSLETAEQSAGIVEAVRRLGPVPVFCTIPPQLDRDELQGRWEFARDTSRHMAELARDLGAPLFDQWTALTSGKLINDGMIEFQGGFFDGFHLETQGGTLAPEALQQSVDFRPEALVYGNNLRNLLMLQVLEALDSSLV